MLRALSVALISTILVACGSAGNDHAAPSETVLEVDEAFIVRPAAGRDITGAGMTISLTGPDIMLVAAETDIAEAVELHTMSMDDGVMRMRKVETFQVSEANPLHLERGGAHLMLFGLNETIETDEFADILLTFKNQSGETQTLVTKAEIRAQGE